MPKYTYQIIHQNSNFKDDFIFEEWITASSKYEAKQDIERVYPYIEGYICNLIKEE